MKPSFIPSKKTLRRDPQNLLSLRGEYYDEKTKTYLRAQQEAYSQANNTEFINELLYKPASSIGLDDPTLYYDNEINVVTQAYASYTNELTMHKRQGDMMEKTQISSELMDKLRNSNELFEKRNIDILRKAKNKTIGDAEAKRQLEKLNRDITEMYKPILERSRKMPKMYRVRGISSKSFK